MAKKVKKHSIVIAWLQDTLVAPRGLSPRVVQSAKAAQWLRRGTAADVGKARAYCTKEGCQVFVFPTGERDPVAKARARVTYKRR